jgi:hypothetical protein
LPIFLTRHTAGTHHPNTPPTCKHGKISITRRLTLNLCQQTYIASTSIYKNMKPTARNPNNDELQIGSSNSSMNTYFGDWCHWSPADIEWIIYLVLGKHNRTLEMGRMNVRLDFSSNSNICLHWVPRSICHLMHIQELKLSCWSVKLMSLSPEIEELSSLKCLALVECSKKLRFLSVKIGKLMSLEVLGMSCCSLLPCVPAEIGNLPNFLCLRSALSMQQECHDYELPGWEWSFPKTSTSQPEGM